MIVSERQLAGNRQPSIDSEDERDAGLLLTRIYRRDCFQIIEQRASKEEVISSLVGLLVDQSRFEARYAKSITEKLLRRERFGSSAIDKGFAIPHLRTRDVDDFIGAVGIAPHGVNFDSIDREPTKLILLTLVPFDQRYQHVQLLSRLAHLMRNKQLDMQILHPVGADEVFKLLADVDGL